MNTTQIDKYFIVSLPRTGTKSLCSMTSTLGLTFKHVPSSVLPRLLKENEIQVFADTPVFTPSTFIPLTDSVNHKFIYIKRNVDEWVDSFERVNLSNNYMALHTGKIAENCITKMDRTCLEEIFDNQNYSTDLAKDRFDWHYNQVLDNIPENRLLIYEFDMGWDPLCEFMGKDIPEEPIPQINKNTMFDPII